MLRRYTMARKVAREISRAADGAFEGYRGGRKVDEPDITAQIVGEIRRHMRGRKFGGVIWDAHTLTSRGKDAEEKIYGADLMSILDIDLPDYKIKKGFLAQVKKAEPGKLSSGKFSPHEWNILGEQCEKMVKRTPDSFVFVYSRKKGIRIFPAVSVLRSELRDIFDLYHYSVQTFFENHLKCFIGDLRLDSTDVRTLEILADFPVRRIFHLRARLSE